MSDAAATTTPEIAYRSTTKTFTFGFFSDDAQTVPVIPADTSAYPRVQVVDQDGTIYITATPPAVRPSGSPGFWAYDFHVPPDATVTATGEAWEFAAEIVNAAGRHSVYRTTFVVKDSTVLKAVNMERFYSVVTGRGVRVMYKSTVEPYAINLNVLVSGTTANFIVQNASLGYTGGSIQHATSEGIHVYYYDIPAFTTPGVSLRDLSVGNWQVHWGVQETITEPELLVYQIVSVFDNKILEYVPQVTFVVDKLEKRATSKQAYKQSDIIGGILNGLQFMNSVFPYTDYTVTSIPEVLKPYMYLGAGYWIYCGQLGLAVDLSFNFCVTGDTYVRTARNGMVQMKKLLEGHPPGLSDIDLELLTPNGVERVEKAFVSRNKVPIVKIETESGYYLKARAEHPVLTYDKDTAELKFVQMKDLTTSHYVAIDNNAREPKRVESVDTKIPETLSTYNFYFDRVVNVRLLKKKETVYDVVLPDNKKYPIDHIFVTNGIVSHNTGQSVSIDQDQTGGIESLLERYRSALWDQLKEVKTDVLRHSRYVGVVSTRPHRARYRHNLVFRISQQHSTTLITFLNMIGLI